MPISQIVGESLQLVDGSPFSQFIGQQDDIIYVEEIMSNSFASDQHDVSPTVLKPLDNTQQSDSVVGIPTTKSSSANQVASKRLPVPCPVPSKFCLALEQSIQKENVSGNMKLTLIREASEFYCGICPNPTASEYQTMAKTLCDEFPSLKNKIPVNGAYWVRYIIF